MQKDGHENMSLDAVNLMGLNLPVTWLCFFSILSSLWCAKTRIEDAET